MQGSCNKIHTKSMVLIAANLSAIFEKIYNIIWILEIEIEISDDHPL